MSELTTAAQQPTLEELLGGRPITPEITKRLTDAGKALDNDPRFQADLAGGEFVARVLWEMNANDISQIGMSQILGTTRQYISRVLNKDSQRNYTLDTLFTFSFAVGLKPRIEYDEICKAVNTILAPRSWLPSSGPTDLTPKQIITNVGNDSPCMWSPQSESVVQLENNPPCIAA